MKTLPPCLALVLAALCPASLTAQNHTDRGAVFGGLAGALAGAGIGEHNGEAGAGALIGGAVGLITGAAIGNSMDRDVAHARAVQQQQIAYQRQAHAHFVAQQQRARENTPEFLRIPPVPSVPAFDATPSSQSRHLFICSKVFGPAIGITRVIECVDTQKDVVGVQNLSPSQSQMDQTRGHCRPSVPAQKCSPGYSDPL